jgi:DNA-binding NarL/FixJ family response regulator
MFHQEENVKFKRNSKLARYFDMLSAIVAESFYVIDVAANQFCYAKPGDVFLFGFSAEKVLSRGYDFYAQIVYPDDLSLWTGMRKAVLQYLKSFKEKRDAIDYFSCTFRLQCKRSFLIRPLPQMVCHRMKPVWEGDELRYLICSVESSTLKEAGNLCMHNKNGWTYEEYNFRSGRWTQKTKESLTERERTILMLAGQGKTTGEIADCLCKGQNTIRNQIKAIFSKLNIHSMQEALELASNCRMIRRRPGAERQATESPRKRSRVLVTTERLQRIQQYLEEGNSIRKAAKREGVAESAVRYWIKQGKLKRTNRPAFLCQM